MSTSKVSRRQMVSIVGAAVAIVPANPRLERVRERGVQKDVGANRGAVIRRQGHAQAQARGTAAVAHALP